MAEICHDSDKDIEEKVEYYAEKTKSYEMDYHVYINYNAVYIDAGGSYG